MNTEKRKEGIIDFLKNSILFSNLDSNILSFLSLKLEPKNLTANEVLMVEGDPGDSLYLIQQGEVVIAITDNEGKEIIVTERKSGESVGEIALLTGEKRTAKVYSKKGSRLLCLSKSVFDHLIDDHPSAFKQITQAIIQRLEQAQLQQILHGSKLFIGLNHSVLKDLESKLSVEMVNSGNYLVNQGEESDSLHIIISGRLQVVTEQPDKSLKIWAELGRGQTVGEMGILTGEKRSASVYALRDTLVAKLSKKSFYRLVSIYPEIITKHTCGGIINRLWQQVQGTSREINTLATFAVFSNNEELALDEFCESLSRALSIQGPTLNINSQRLDQMLDKKGMAQTEIDSPSNITLIRWLSEQETQYRYIIYQADTELTPWTKRCLRQADRIIQVCDAQSKPNKGRLFSYLQEQKTSIEKMLVLLHDPSTKNPQETSRWMDQVQTKTHIHIKRSSQRDYNHLSRMLTGNSIGLVLSGGGARGLAHIGAIRAMEEAGIEIDMAGGTSMGAVIAAQVAMGLNSQSMLELTTSALAKHNKFQYTLPILSILTGASWHDFLRELYGEIQIEDLWLNFFCCSTNLTDNQLNIHDCGQLWKSVRASSSIPGLIPPYFDRGKMLVDGAVINNMPVDIMRARNNGGKIYACDVGGGGMKEKPLTDLKPVQSGWPLFFRRDKHSNQIPSIGAILMQSATMGSQLTQQTTMRMADLYLHPDVSQFSLLDFGTIEPVVEQGYRCASEQIEQWQKEK